MSVGLHPALLFLEERKIVETSVILKKRRSGGIASMYTNTCRQGSKKTRPSSFQWCPVTGQEAMGTN